MAVWWLIVCGFHQSRLAVMAELETRVARLLADQDLGGLDAVAQNGIFGNFACHDSKRPLPSFQFSEASEAFNEHRIFGQGNLCVR